MLEKMLKDKWYWLTLLVGTVVFYVLNANTPLIGDDILFSRVPDDISRPCDTLGQYIASMPFFYCDNNGRIADMMVRFVTSLLGKGVFNVLNSLVFIVFLLVVSRHIDETNRRVWHLVATMLYMLLLMPVAGQTMLWLSGTINYLWSSTATLALLLAFGRERWPWPLPVKVLVLLGAFIAGGMNESVSSATLACMVLYCIVNRKAVTRWHLAVIALYLAGFLLIVLSPAAWDRLATSGSVNVNMTPLRMVVQRLYNLATKSIHFVTPAAALCTVAVLARARGFKAMSAGLMNWCLAGAVISVLVFGVYTIRFYTWYSIVGFVVVAQALAPSVDSHRRVSLALCTVCALGCIVTSPYAIASAHSYSKFNDSVLNAVKSSPDGVIIAPTQFEERRFVHAMDFSNDRYTGYNRALGYWLGKPNVHFLNDSVYSLYRGEQPMMHDAKPVKGVESSDSSVVNTLYALPSAGISAAPIVGDDVELMVEYKGNMYYNDMESLIGKDRAALRRLWGTMSNAVPFITYVLERDGHRYIILPPVTDEVTGMDFWVRAGGEKKQLRLTLTK